MSITVEWIKDQQYAVTDDKGHGIVMESKSEGSTAGFTPSQLLLVAAAGCLANHVLDILRKKRLPPIKLKVLTDGRRREEHPRRYTSLTLRFDVTGEVSQTILEEVVRLAKEKYCSVLNTLDPNLEVLIECTVAKG
jgi:putative redox protein